MSAPTEPSFSREMLEAARAGQRAGWSTGFRRSDNPHGDLSEPGALTLARFWLAGFNRGRQQRRDTLSRALPAM